MSIFKRLAALTAMLCLTVACAFSAVAATAEKQATLVFSAEEDFSDLGSDFWNYYYINCDDEAKMNELMVHGSGLFGDYYADGSFGYEYKYVVGPADYVASEYHDYLAVWGGVMLHPGGNADAVMSFVAPVDGVVNITATIKEANTNSDGVKIFTTVNGMEDNIYPAGEDYLLHTTTQTQYEIKGLAVKRGDEIFFRINKNQTLAHDATYFSPTVEYTSYTLPENVALDISDTSLSIPVGGIRLLEAELNINVGQELVYTFTASDSSVVKVLENGLIYALKEGTAEITVKEETSGLSAICRVNVVKDGADGAANGGEKRGCGGGIAVDCGAVAAVAVIAIVVGIVINKKKSRA